MTPYYDAYKGVIVYVRIKEGQVHTGDVIRMMATGATFTVVECGYMRAGGGTEPSDVLSAGEVGYIAASIKSVQDAHVGDTITLHNRPAAEPLPVTEPYSQWYSAAFIPADGAHYSDLRDALEKLQLNDAAP